MTTKLKRSAALPMLLMLSAYSSAPSALPAQATAAPATESVAPEDSPKTYSASVQKFFSDWVKKLTDMLPK